ncbi:unconventional myosin-IXb isoform E [Alligator mississippiensis]|uniref:Unconventional myosin-IXb isoform E n=1 Tax=Alligator mississippiensis TaxID=8496 RepID=A0A151ML91_ALLMI|nr:unconventional myosin-IXb isoform E [Alligator mississippiensis]
MMLWPRMALENRLSGEDYRFLLREKNLDGSIHYGSLQSWLRVTEERRRMVERGFLPQPPQKDYDDLCSLPDLNEKTLLENLRNRFKQEKIYTYVGSILIVINPFKFLPIYNPKYVKMYDNHQLGKLEPHIYAVADVAYHAMLQRRKNQCIVISGESGSGKTQSTNFLIHHLTALSQKGFASGVEQIILGAGPVLEAFGNAKTAHNNNSSRFGKFIQVNYQETGTVRGAYVEKYLLEKSRLVYQEHNERNYHVFYYLLAGAREEERSAFHLKQPEEYHYLNQMTKKPLRQSWDDYYYDSEPDCFSVEGEDLKHDFERLQLAMEMVGFLPKTRRQIFSLLSAILHLGNICYKKKTYRDDSIDICNPEVLPVVSELLEVKEEMLFEALVTRKTVTVGEKLILPYKLAEAVTVRNSMAKSLYSALFDWIVFRINHALLNAKDVEESTKTLSIGVLDIFGFEDYENNSFEQFCINFANERLQHYFNQHIFKLEQEEYRAEGISWHNIDYIDNSGCINLISKKPTGLLHLLDEESNFPQATNQTLLDKFKRQHEGNSYIEFPAVMEPAFIIKHYAGKVKYGVKDFREKNTDHMRPDIVALLRSSKNAFICGMIGIDPVAVFRWAVLRAFFRAMVAFREAGKRYIEKKTGHDDAVPCAVLKSVDSFSFLHHPVHQRSLEILQRCKEEKYSITRKSPRTPLSDLQGVNTINERTHRDAYGVGWNARMAIRQGRLSSPSSFLDKDGIFVNSTNSKLLERAHGILMRNKNFKAKLSLPKHLLDVKSLKHLTNLTLHDRITKSLLHLHKKKKPPSISAQFQASLNKLMETLGQAEPYFVKCIRSNAEKLPLRFNDNLVLRQLRYTGMLETVRIRQSGYSCKYSFQDFVDHFHVLLPQGVSPSKRNILDFFRKIKLNSDNYQVGRTMVFMKEQERQVLQGLLHEEVLRRITLLQRWFRTMLYRRQFLNLRQAAVIIQRCWRSYQNRKQAKASLVDPLVLSNAAVILQSYWRAYLERRKFLQMRVAAFIIQNCWREHCRRKHAAAMCIQAGWRGYCAKRLYKAKKKQIILLQAACRGYIVRQRFRALKEQRLKETQLENGLSVTEEDGLEVDGALKIKGSDPSKWEDGSFEERVRAIEEHKSLIENNRVNHTDPLDGPENLLHKRHERASSQDGVDIEEEIADNLKINQSLMENNLRNKLMEKEERLVIFPGVRKDTEPDKGTALNSESGVKPPVKTEESVASLAPEAHSADSVIKRLEKLNVEKEERQKQLQLQREKEMMEQIRQQKEILEKERKAFQQLERQGKGETLQRTEPNRVKESSLRLLKKTADTRPQSLFILNPQNKVEHCLAPTTTPTSSVDIKGLTVAKKGSSPAHSAQKDRPVSMFMERKEDSHFSLHFNKESSNQCLSKDELPRKPLNVPGPGRGEVARPAHKKKARMARTRSDFLTRGTFADGEGDTEEDDYDDNFEFLLSSDQPTHPEPGPTARLGQACHSDSEMISQRFASGEGQTRLHKTMSQGEIGKLATVQKNLAPDGRPQRAKMKFWTKGKQGEKKTPREKLATQSELLELYAEQEASGREMIPGLQLGEDLGPHHLTPPRSPELSGIYRREFKENKEPSPKVKRKRSVKISNVALEPVQWQNDSLQIITSASDLKSMDEFLLKKMNDLDNEDSKKDTLVDVVFKKALKEFRQNIFSFYSSALAMDDGKSIRYKDLYALFEQILEKTMRLEQRDWSESPVKVWVNTFKVFLDEYMIEYKPLDYAAVKPLQVPKTERKKRRKKEADVVEEHNGHIFKATQYSIPTYCEYCSSLIWIMDRASVCKLCKYACHKKCCLKTTTKCSKKYDPELSSRQFGVELSRLTSEERAVPVVVEKLINYIEMHGLYTEGIYRKSGSTNKIKELRQGLDTDIDNVNLDDYNIHVIASVFKQWLRDLPNPLMTFELYEEFLRAMGLQERKETIRGVYSVIDQLSRTHLNTLERLVFHLVRIALQEDTNRMSANALAIVFAPCILRCPDTTDPLQSVQDISKTTTCVELIVVEQMNKYRARLKDINSLEFAENKAKSRLSLIRRSMGKGRIRRGTYTSPTSPVAVRLPSVSDVPEETVSSEEAMEMDVTEQQQAAMQQEERVLTEQIESLQKEKEELTFEMLALEPRASDDETLESEASIGTADSSENLNFDSEGAISDRSERSLALSSLRPVKTETSSRKRFQMYSKPPFYRAGSSGDTTETRLGLEGSPGQLRGLEDRPQFTSRGTFNPEKGKQKLKNVKNSPQKTKELPEGAAGAGRKRNAEADCSSTQQLVLFGNNEFMV